MARVPYLQQSDLPPEHQDILARPIALNRAMANSPNAAKAMTGLAMYIRHHSKLDQRLRELAILQVGYLARSPYEYSHHVKLGREAGVTDDETFAHLRRSVELLPRFREDARRDDDFAAVRDDPRFEEALR